MNVFYVKMCNIYTVNQNNDKQPRDGTKKGVEKWLMQNFLRDFGQHCKVTINLILADDVFCIQL